MLRYHFFDQTLVTTEKQENGEFVAVIAYNNEIYPAIGRGKTRLEAISDLGVCLRERGELED